MSRKGRLEPPNLAYASKEARLESFNVSASGARRKAGRSWPLPPSHSITPEALAHAGFYYSPTPESSDSAKCFHCHKVLGGWEQGDDALDEHQAHMPTGIICPWVVICMLERDRQEEQKTGKKIINDVDSEALFQARKATYGSAWAFDQEAGAIPTSEAMARAGFHYAPPGDDNVVCALCTLSLEGWVAEDDPLNEHRARRPKCLFFDPSYSVKSEDSPDWETIPTAPVSKASTTASKKRAPAKSKKARTSDAQTESSQPPKLSQAALRKQSIAALRKPRAETPSFGGPSKAPAQPITVEISPPPPIPVKSAARKVAKTKRGDESDEQAGPSRPSTVPQRMTRSASQQQQTAIQQQSEAGSEKDPPAPASKPKAKAKVVRKKKVTSKVKAVVQAEPEREPEAEEMDVDAEEPVASTQVTVVETDVEMQEAVIEAPQPVVPAPPVIDQPNEDGWMTSQLNMTVSQFAEHVKKQEMARLNAGFEHVLEQFDTVAAKAREAILADFEAGGLTIPADARKPVAVL